MHIGIIAPEFPPQVGGMPAYALGITNALASRDRVTVYTIEGRGVAGQAYEQQAVLARDLRRAIAPLSGARVDGWFMLNAGCLVLAPELQAPTVATVHGNDFLSPWLVWERDWVNRMRYRRYWWRHSDRIRQALVRRDIGRGLRAAAHVFTVSEYSRSRLEALYPHAGRKLSVVPPGVDDRFFAPPARDRRRGDGPLRLLTVTRLEHWTRRKNVDGVIEAIALVTPEIPCEYVVVGEGNDRPRLEALAHERGVGGCVRFTGRVTSEDLLVLYDRADLFVLASKAGPRDIEGFGIVFLEAAAMGLPSICSAEGGATDGVRDGETGIVIARSSPESIAAGIRRFVRGRDRFAPEPLRAFAEPFRWPHVAARIRLQLEAAVQRR